MQLFVLAFDLSDPLWPFLFGVIGLAITVIGIPTLVSIIKSIRDKPEKRLSYQFVSDVGLVNHEKDSDKNITVMLKGGPIGNSPVEANDARIIMLKLINSGAKALDVSDFKHGGQAKLRFEFEDANLIYCAVHDTDPEDIIKPEERQKAIHLDPLTSSSNKPLQTNTAIQVSPSSRRLRSTKQTKPAPKAPQPTNRQRFHQYVDLNGCFLNPNNTITLKFVTRGKAAVKVKGQLKDGKEIKEYVPPPPLLTARRLAISVIMTFLMGLLISPGIGLIGAFWQGNCAFSFSSVNASGSTAFYETAQTLANDYRRACPIAFLNIASSDSAAGLTQLEKKNLDIANSEISPKEAGYDYKDLVEHRVAVIAFTMIVNKDVKDITSLSRDQITQIYNGQFTNWNQVNGPDLQIERFGRSSGSGTHAAFTGHVLEAPEVPIKNSLSSMQEVIDKVGSTPGAIGYADLRATYQASDKVTAINIDGKAPTQGLIESDQYPFWAIERMYTRKEANSLSLSFINYVTRNIQTGRNFFRIEDISVATLTQHDH